MIYTILMLGSLFSGGMGMMPIKNGGATKRRIVQKWDDGSGLAHIAAYNGNTRKWKTMDYESLQKVSNTWYDEVIQPKVRKGQVEVELPMKAFTEMIKGWHADEKNKGKYYDTEAVHNLESRSYRLAYPFGETDYEQPLTKPTHSDTRTQEGLEKVEDEKIWSSCVQDLMEGDEHHGHQYLVNMEGVEFWFRHRPEGWLNYDNNSDYEYAKIDIRRKKKSGPNWYGCPLKPKPPARPQYRNVETICDNGGDDMDSEVGDVYREMKFLFNPDFMRREPDQLREIRQFIGQEISQRKLTLHGTDAHKLNAAKLEIGNAMRKEFNLVKTAGWKVDSWDTVNLEWTEMDGSRAEATVIRDLIRENPDKRGVSRDWSPHQQYYRDVKNGQFTGYVDPNLLGWEFVPGLVGYTDYKDTRYRLSEVSGVAVGGNIDEDGNYNDVY